MRPCGRASAVRASPRHPTRWQGTLRCAGGRAGSGAPSQRNPPQVATPPWVQNLRQEIADVLDRETVRGFCSGVSIYSAQRCSTYGSAARIDPIRNHRPHGQREQTRMDEWRSPGWPCSRWSWCWCSARRCRTGRSEPVNGFTLGLYPRSDPDRSERSSSSRSSPSTRWGKDRCQQDGGDTQRTATQEPEFQREPASGRASWCCSRELTLAGVPDRMGLHLRRAHARDRRRGGPCCSTAPVRLHRQLRRRGPASWSRPSPPVPPRTRGTGTRTV